MPTCLHRFLRVGAFGHTHNYGGGDYLSLEHAAFIRGRCLLEGGVYWRKYDVILKICEFIILMRACMSWQHCFRECC